MSDAIAAPDTPAVPIAFEVPIEGGDKLPGDDITCHWYFPASESVMPERASIGVLVLPIQAGDYAVARNMAEAFARQGFNVLRCERRAEWLDPEKPLSDLPTLLRAYADDISAALDVWPEIAAGMRENLASPPPSQFALCGISMGAIMGTVVAARDRRIEASLLALGGGPLAEVLCTAKDPGVTPYRRQKTKELGLTSATFLDYARQLLEGFEPLELAPLIDPNKVLMVAARFDRVVSMALADNLWRAIGCPRRVVLPSGHYSAAIFKSRIVRAGAEFFCKTLGQQPSLKPPE